MNEKTLPAHPSEVSAHLADELKTVIKRIKEKIGPISNSPLAIVRVIDGLSHEDWVNLVSLYSLHDWLAFTVSDPLTGLSNRRVLFNRLTIELTRAQRTNGDASLAIIDIDNFKTVNDTHGHLCGDAVLKDLGAHLSSNIRLYDTASRVGGEEFAILLPSTPITTARTIIDDIREEFAQHEFIWNGKQFNCTFSAGISSVKALGHSPTPEDFFNSADQAMYTAKRTGKNRVCMHKADYLLQDNHSLVRSHEKQFLFSGIITDKNNE